MSSRSRLMVSAVVGLLALLNAVAVEAQFGRGQPKPQMQPYTGKGTIDMIARGMVKMSSGAEAVVVQFSPNGNIRVLGTAQIDFLRPQMMVQFNATLEKKTGHIEGDVKKLTVCSPGPEFTPGCMPEGGADSAAAGIGTAATGTKPARKSRGAAKEDPGPHPYIVTGSVTKVNKTDSGYKVSVRVPTVKRPVDVMLAEGTQLDVNIADLSLIAQGDSVEITQGQAIKNQMGMMVMATEARITHTAPLTGASKKGGHAKAGHAKKTEEGGGDFPGTGKAGAAKPDAKDAKPKDDNK